MDTMHPVQRVHPTREGCEPPLLSERSEIDDQFQSGSPTPKQLTVLEILFQRMSAHDPNDCAQIPVVVVEEAADG